MLIDPSKRPIDQILAERKSKLTESKTPTNVDSYRKVNQFLGLDSNPDVEKSLNEPSDLSGGIRNAIQLQKRIGDLQKEGKMSFPEAFAQNLGTTAQSITSVPFGLAGKVLNPVVDTAEKVMQKITSPLQEALSGVIGDENIKKIHQFIDTMPEEQKVRWENFFTSAPALGAIAGIFKPTSQAPIVEESINLYQKAKEFKGKGKEAANILLDDTSDTFNKNIPEIKTEPISSSSPDFQEKVNKALPILKKDVNNLPKKYEAVKVVIEDIANNKDKLGFTDKNGATRNPSNFVETNQAIKTRKSDIYNEYTNKLEGADKAQFEESTFNGIIDKINELKQQLNTENTLAGRSAISKKITELETMKDLSPKGIQDYIESLNRESQTAPGAPLKASNITAANIAGSMRSILDKSIDKIQGKGYQDLRNLYGAYKTVEDQFLMAAKKELNNTPGFTDKLANIGLSIEGLNFLLTHNPQAILTGLSIKGGAAFMKYLSSPQRALRGLFEDLSQSIQPSPLSPQTINTIATKESTKSNMTPTIPEPKGKVKPPLGKGETPKLLTPKAKSATMDSMIQEAKKYKSAEEFVKAQPIKIYHSTNQANKDIILREGFKKGSELPEEAFRGGGYGQIQNSISFSDNVKDASRFGISQKNTLIEAELKPNSKIIDRTDIEFAEELNDEIPKLLKEGVDAVRLPNTGEGEIVVINPKVIQKITDSFDYKGVEAKNLDKLFKSKSLTKSQLIDIYNKAHNK